MGRSSPSRLLLMNDEDRSFARALVRQSVARHEPPYRIYLWLAGMHPTLASRAELDRVFQSVGASPPTLLPGQEAGVARRFSPSLARYRSSVSPTGRTVAKIVADLEHPLASRREQALHELAAVKPARAAPILAQMLRSGSFSEIARGCARSRAAPDRRPPLRLAGAEVGCPPFLRTRHARGSRSPRADAKGPRALRPRGGGRTSAGLLNPAATSPRTDPCGRGSGASRASSRALARPSGSRCRRST